MYRRLLATLAVIAALGLAMHIEPTRALSPAQRVAILDTRPPWVLSGAALDLDFVNGRYWTGATETRNEAAVFSVTRASVGYVDDSAGNWTQVASGMIRRSDKGILIEEARTNGIRNNSMQGAAAPGTGPTNWTLPGSAYGLAQTVVGVGTQNGIDYIDIRFNGTTNDTNGINLPMESAGVISAANAQVWTQSAFAAVVGGSLANVNALVVNLALYNGSSSYLGDAANSLNLASATGSLARYSQATTLSGATIASIQPYLRFTFNSGVAIDFTLRIGWPQLEQGSFATSPIRTTNAAVTRNADLVSTTMIPSGLSATTLFAIATFGAPSSFASSQTPLQLDDGTGNNRLLVTRNTSGSSILFLNVSASAQTVPSSAGSISQGARSKLIGGFQAGADSLGLNGTVNTASPASIPSGLTTLRIGGATGNPGGQLYIERAALFSSFLPTAQQQALTR